MKTKYEIILETLYKIISVIIALLLCWGVSYVFGIPYVNVMVGWIICAIVDVRWTQ